MLLFWLVVVVHLQLQYHKHLAFEFIPLHYCCSLQPGQNMLADEKEDMLHEKLFFIF